MIAVVDVYNVQPLYVMDVVPVGWYCPVYYYVVASGVVGASNVPELQFKVTAGIPVVVGGGVVYADLSDPESQSGWAWQIGPYGGTGGKDFSFSPILGIGGSFTQYAGTGYYVWTLVAGGTFVPPLDWAQKPVISSTTGTSIYSGGGSGYGGGGGGRHYCY